MELIRLDLTVDIPCGSASQFRRPPWKCLPLFMRSFRPPMIDPVSFGAGVGGGGGIAPDGVGGSGTALCWFDTCPIVTWLSGPAIWGKYG